MLSKIKTLFINYWPLYLIIFFGAVLRLWGIWFDYPLTNSIGDEPHLISGALRMLNDKSILVDSASIRYFPLMYYINAIGAVIFSVILFIFTDVNSVSTLKEHVILNLGDWIILSRFISALLGIASICLVYLISQMIFNNKYISYIAALFFTVSPYQVSLSHLGKIWTPLSFFILFGVYVYLHIWSGNTEIKNKPILYTTLIFFTVFLTSLYGFIIYPLLLIIIFVYYSKLNIKTFIKFLKSKTSLLLHFYLLVSVFLIKILAHGAVNNVIKNFKIFVLGDPTNLQPDFRSTELWKGSILYKLGTSLNFLLQFETVVLVLLFPAFWYLYKKNKQIFYFLFISFIVLFLATNPPLLSVTRPRYFSFVLPFMFFPVAFLVYSVFVKLKQKNIVFSVLLLIFVFGPATFISARDNYLNQQNSTKLEMYNWIKENLKEGENIFLSGAYMVQDFIPDKKLLQYIKEYSPDFYSSRMKYINDELEGDYQSYGIYTNSYYCKWPQEIRHEVQFDYVLVAWENDYKKPATSYVDLCGEDQLFFSEENVVLERDTSPHYEYNIGNYIETESYTALLEIQKKGPSFKIYKLK